MDINSLEIKNKTNYDINNISYIDDFNVNSLRVTKKESRNDANIYYIRFALNPDDFINDLIGYIEEIDGSSDTCLIVVSSLRNKNIISAIDTIWRSIENKINPGIKIKDYGKFRFNSDIDLPLNTIIEFRSLLINVSCVIEKDNEYYPEIYLDECSYVKYNPGPIKTFFPKNMGINILPARQTKVQVQRIYKMNELNELDINSTLWTTPLKIINLLDFKPKKLSTETNNNSNNNIKVHHVRYENDGFYLTIDNIKGYFNFSNNLDTLNMIFANDDQQNKYHQVWKEILKIINGGDGELKLHEKIRLFDNDLPVKRVFKIPSITIAIKSLIEKNNKFYLELSLNHCLYEI